MATKLHQKLFWLLVFLLPLQLGRHFWPPSSLVLGLRVDYLSPTIYLTDILVFLILCLWGFEAIIHSQLSILNFLKKHWWILAVFLFLLVSSFFAQNPMAALYKFVKIVEFSLLGLYIAKNRYTLSPIRYPLTLAVVYSSIIAIMQFFFQSSLGGPFWWLGERTFSVATPGIAKTIINGELMMRPYGTFPHPNVLAGFVLVSLIFVIANFNSRSNRQKILRWLALILGIITIVLSFSRSVWLIGLILFFFFLWQKIKKKFFWLATLGFLAVLTMFFYLLPHFSTNEAFFQRWQLMKAAGLMIKNAPLAGIGLNNFIVRLPDYWPVTGFTYWLQPVHNLYLLIVAETGLVGLMIFFWLLILTYKRSLFLADARNKKLFKTLTINHWSLVICLTAILLLGFVDHYWLTLQQTQLLFAIVLGLSWAKH